MIPRDYDTWILRGPDEPDEPKMVECDDCEGLGFFRKFGLYGMAKHECEICHGTGEVEADAEEYETERGEWLRDRRDGL